LNLSFGDLFVHLQFIRIIYSIAQCTMILTKNRARNLRIRTLSPIELKTRKIHLTSFKFKTTKIYHSNINKV